MEMTEFEKAKQKEWDEFGKLNLTTKTELFNTISKKLEIEVK